MKFVDHASIEVIAGKGGAGAISFRREKYIPKGGPNGGDGGAGGSVILKATTKLQTLMDLKIRRQYQASHGLSGQQNNKNGANYMYFLWAE